MPVYKVPKDPPPYGLSFETMVLGDSLMRRAPLMLIWIQIEIILLGLPSLMQGLSLEMFL